MWKVGWERLFASQWMPGKWEVFKSELERYQMPYVSVRVKGKSGRIRKPWLAKDINALVRKKQSYVRYRHIISSKYWEYASPLGSVRDLGVQLSKLGDQKWDTRFFYQIC